MKISLYAQIYNSKKHLRVTVYEQENGKWFAIRVGTAQEKVRGAKDYCTTHHDLETSDAAVALAEL